MTTRSGAPQLAAAARAPGRGREQIRAAFGAATRSEQWPLFWRFSSGIGPRFRLRAPACSGVTPFCVACD